MFFRITCYPKAKAHFSHRSRELISETVPVRMRSELPLIYRGIAAQGKNVFNAERVQLFQNGTNFVFGMTDTGQVRHGLHAEFFLDASHEFQGFRARTS